MTSNNDDARFIARSLLFLATDTAAVLAFLIDHLKKYENFDLPVLMDQLESFIGNTDKESDGVYRMPPFLLELLKGMTDPSHPSHNNPQWLQEVIEGGLSKLENK